MDAAIKLCNKGLLDSLESLGMQEGRGDICKQEKLDLLHFSQFQGMSLS